MTKHLRAFDTFVFASDAGWNEPEGDRAMKRFRLSKAHWRRTLLAVPVLWIVSLPVTASFIDLISMRRG